MSRIFLFGLISTLLLCLFGCAALDDSQHQAPLRVGISPGYPPIAFKQDGQLSGIEVELGRLAGERLGRDIEFREIAWGELIFALEQGDIDVIMSGMSITADRQLRVDFVTPYLTIGQMALIHRDRLSLAEPGGITYPGRRIGVEQNTTGEIYAKSQLTQAIVQRYTSVSAGISALKKDEIDYFIHDAPTIWRYTLVPGHRDEALLGLYHPLTKESLAWAVKPGHQTLKQQLDQVVEELKADGSIKQVVDRWLPLQATTKSP